MNVMSAGTLDKSDAGGGGNVCRVELHALCGHVFLRPPLCGLILAQRICSCKVEICIASKEHFSPLHPPICVRSTGRVMERWKEGAMIVNGAARPLGDTVVAVGKGSIYRNDAVFVFHTFG